MQTFLLVAAIIFIVWDVLMGLRRGLFPALVRFAFVGLCFLAAYLFSSPLSHFLVEIPLPFLGGETLHAWYEGYLYSQEGLATALALSEAIEQLVLHLPDVLIAEIDFILLFVLLRVFTLPLSFLVSRLLFGKPEKKKKKHAQNNVEPVIADAVTHSAVENEAPAEATENAETTAEALEEAEPVTLVIEKKKKKKEKRSLAGTVRWGGMAVGLVQAVVCFAVILVPIFGVVEFGERFYDSFANSEEEILADIALDVKTELTDPLEDSIVTKASEALGVRHLCVSIFHNLSNTTLELSSGDRVIDYFDYLESMFPAVSALLKLSDVDPSHMTDKDYENLSVVLQTAQDHDDIAQAVQDSVSNVVTEFVDDSYRASADVVINRFANKVVSEKNSISPTMLKNEVSAIEKTMQVIQTATSESASSAFEVVKADELVDEIIKTESLYETLIEVANDSEERAVLVQDFTSTDEQKEEMKAEIEKYRAESLESRSPEELAKILALTDALAGILDLELDALPTT